MVSEQKRDEAQTQWQAAKYTESAALQMYQLAKEGAREETKQAALEKARMAAGAVAEVEAYAADTKIQSWFDGEVSQVLMHSGELAPQGFLSSLWSIRKTLGQYLTCVKICSNTLPKVLSLRLICQL